MKAILEGIRVLEWAIHHAGPEAAKLMGDLGAEVIKIEERVTGDPSRSMKKFIGVIPTEAPGGRNYYFEGFNRNKKSLSIDLKHPQGQEVVYRLVARSDIFLTNYRRPAAERLGLDYPRLRQHNPKLIYCRVSAFGRDGPDADNPGFDFAGQSRSGILRVQREPDDTPFTPGGLGDQMASISAAYGILAALVARERHGIGQELHASIYGGMLWVQASNLITRLHTGQEPPPLHREMVATPLRNTYRAGDGKWLSLAMATTADHYWPAFCRALKIEELAPNPRFATLDAREHNSPELIAILDQVFATKPREEWLRILKDADIPTAPVNTLSDVLTDPQALQNQYVVDYHHPVIGPMKTMGSPVYFSETPFRITRPAPMLGENNEEVLSQAAGYSPQEIARLREQGVI